MIEALPLDFTAHCQVRYIERFLDEEAVVQARRRAKNDVATLAALEPQFSDDLRHFRHVVQVAYFHLLHRASDFVAGTPYWLNLGTLSVCIEGNRAKTTVCKHYTPATRPDPPDDDPMEERGQEFEDYELAA